MNGSQRRSHQPSLEHGAAFSAVVLTTTGLYWKLSGTFARLKGWMASAGVQPDGPALGIFYDDPTMTPPEQCRYRIAYPLTPAGVAAAGQALGRVPVEPGDTLEVAHFPEGPVAVLTYEGPAADSPSAYIRLANWVESQGLRPSGPPQERYLAEPGTLSKGLMRAELRQPVAPGG